jgi:hypothetical protein
MLSTRLWRVERKPDFVSLLRAAAEHPEMADVPLGHFRAAYDVMKEGEWECFRSSMSEFPTTCGKEQEASKTSLAELKAKARENQEARAQSKGKELER